MLDRNIGADRVCISKADSSCYGGYYQWGRETDGHESTASNIANTQATAISSVGDTFHYGFNDWTTADTDGSLRQQNWGKTDGTVLCPTGYRVPTKSEFQAELDLNSPFDDSNFNAFLKLSVAGFHDANDGTMTQQGEAAYYWSQDANDTGTTHAKAIAFVPSQIVAPHIAPRSQGYQVRCIKD